MRTFNRFNVCFLLLIALGCNRSENDVTPATTVTKRRGSARCESYGIQEGTWQFAQGFARGQMDAINMINAYTVPFTIVSGSLMNPGGRPSTNFNSDWGSANPAFASVNYNFNNTYAGIMNQYAAKEQRYIGTLMDVWNQYGGASFFDPEGIGQYAYQQYLDLMSKAQRDQWLAIQNRNISSSTKSISNYITNSTTFGVKGTRVVWTDGMSSAFLNAIFNYGMSFDSDDCSTVLFKAGMTRGLRTRLAEYGWY